MAVCGCAWQKRSRSPWWAGNVMSANSASVSKYNRTPVWPVSGVLVAPVFVSRSKHNDRLKSKANTSWTRHALRGGWGPCTTCGGAGRIPRPSFTNVIRSRLYC